METSLVGWAKNRLLLIGVFLLKPFFNRLMFREILIWGDKKRLTISPTASMANTLFNTIGGRITVGEYTFTGHNVSILTGSHNLNTFLRERLLEYPSEGGDISIGSGVWISSNATILGPCQIGDHAVIAAGAIVTSDVSEGTIVGGVPARVIKHIKMEKGVIADASSPKLGASEPS